MNKQSLLAAAAAAFLVSPASAVFVADANPGTIGDQPGSVYQPLVLSGNTTSEGWTNLSVSGTTGTGWPGFPGSAAWPRGIASQTGPNAGLSSVIKTANGTGGGPYPAGSSVYFGGFSGDVNNNGGTLTVTPATVLADLQTVVFQVDIGEAWTYDFYNGVLPTLTYTTASGSTTVAADHSSLYNQYFNGTVTMPSGEEPLYNNSYALQWDLGNVGEPITGFSISLTGVQHAQLYGLGLQQSDEAFGSSILPAAVPEPSSLALLGAAGLLAFVRRVRR